MSQEKVDRYKAGKAGRKLEAQKKRRQHLISGICGAVIGLALVFWLGISGYNKYEEAQPRTEYEVDTTALTDYESDLSAEAEE